MIILTAFPFCSLYHKVSRRLVLECPVPRAQGLWAWVRPVSYLVLLPISYLLAAKCCYTVYECIKTKKVAEVVFFSNKLGTFGSTEPMNPFWLVVSLFQINYKEFLWSPDNNIQRSRVLFLASIRSLQSMN